MGYVRAHPRRRRLAQRTLMLASRNSENSLHKGIGPRNRILAQGNLDFPVGVGAQSDPCKRAIEFASEFNAPSGFGKAPKPGRSIVNNMMDRLQRYDFADGREYPGRPFRMGHRLALKATQEASLPSSSASAWAVRFLPGAVRWPGRRVSQSFLPRSGSALAGFAAVRFAR